MRPCWTCCSNSRRKPRPLRPRPPRRLRSHASLLLSCVSLVSLPLDLGLATQANPTGHHGRTLRVPPRRDTPLRVSQTSIPGRAFAEADQPQGRMRKPHRSSNGFTSAKYVVLSSPSGEDVRRPTALTVPSGFRTKPGLPLSPSRLYTLASTMSPSMPLTAPQVSPVTAPILQNGMPTRISGALNTSRTKYLPPTSPLGAPRPGSRRMIAASRWSPSCSLTVILPSGTLFPYRHKEPSCASQCPLVMR